jgi:GNAT superfamily N-acetyltransferase
MGPSTNQPEVGEITYWFATVADVNRIAALHARSWQETYRGIMPDSFLDNEVEQERLNVWQERFQNPPDNRQVILAEANKQLVGFACVVVGEDPVYGALLDNLHVASAYKGRGVGRALMKQAAEWVHRKDAASSFYLWVYKKNVSARRFYEELGAINQEALSSENGPVLRYVWPDINKLIQG